MTTTQVYTLVTVDRLREVYATSHPRARADQPAARSRPRTSSVCSGRAGLRWCQVAARPIAATRHGSSVGRWAVTSA